MNKCEICKVYVSYFNQEKSCAFEHNGDKDICPFEDEYLNLSMHDEKVRADERAKVLTQFLFELGKNIAYEKEKVFGTDVIKVDVLMTICTEIEEQLKEQSNE